MDKFIIDHNLQFTSAMQFCYNINIIASKPISKLKKLLALKARQIGQASRTGIEVTTTIPELRDTQLKRVIHSLSKYPITVQKFMTEPS